MTPTFRATIKNGTIDVQLKDRFRDYIYKLEGQPVYVTVKKPYPNRSDNQNRYYWGVVVQLIAESTGYTPEEAHEALKWKFLVDRQDKLPIAGSTSDKNTTEMEEYMSIIRAWASAELNCYIPLPYEVTI